MFAAAAGHSNLGISPSVGKEFAESDPGGKLPEKVGKDLAPRKWKILKRLFGEWLDEEEAEPEHQTVDGWDEWSPEAREAAAKARQKKTPFERAMERTNKGIAKTEREKAKYGGLTAPPKGKKIQGPSEYDPNNPAGHKRFDSADDNWTRRGRAASVALTTGDGHVLLLRRARDETNWPDTWSFPGGKAEDDEDDESAARRELGEETGYDGALDGMAELERTRTPNDFEHVTYVVPVREKFEPKLSREHSGFMWAPVTRLPENTHPGVRAAIDRVIGKVADDDGARDKKLVVDLDDDENQLTKLLTHIKETASVGHSFEVVVDPEDPEHRAKFFIDGDGAFRIKKVEQAADELAMDWTGTAILSHSPPCELGLFDPNGPVPPVFDFAYDRESARQYDADGHLHVRDVNIAKASVNEYLGEEIPDWEKLGLDPKRKYRLWRHPDELKKAVPTANGKPILDDHAPINADTHDRKMVVGSVGTDARWEPPFVKSTLSFWPAKASREIESNRRRALSPAYRYRPDMTPGRTPDGEPYDGVMRDISFSHLAQIPEGRQGPDIVVTDELFTWSTIERALQEMMVSG
jgi:8-oxo-dGTP pyrophosphatase MutT (NUDIX family)